MNWRFVPGNINSHDDNDCDDDDDYDVPGFFQSPIIIINIIGDILEWSNIRQQHVECLTDHGQINSENEKLLSLLLFWLFDDGDDDYDWK